MSKRRKFTAEFKTKVVLEALKERQTLTELAQKYQIQPNQLKSWKKEFLSNASTAFEDKAKKISDKETDAAKLYEKIGQLQVEVDFLKKSLW
jgi:transposase